MSHYYPIKFIYHDTHPKNKKNISEQGFVSYQADDETYDGNLVKHGPKIVFFCSTLAVINGKFKLPSTVIYPRSLEEGNICRFVVDINKLKLETNYVMFQVKSPTQTTCLQVHVLFINKNDPRLKHYTKYYEKVDISSYKYFNFQENTWKQLFRDQNKKVFVNLCIASEIEKSMIMHVFDFTFYKGSLESLIENEDKMYLDVDRSYGSAIQSLCQEIDNKLKKNEQLTLEEFQCEDEEEKKILEFQKTENSKTIEDLGKTRERTQRINEKYANEQYDINSDEE